jgi:hypothetical protein
MSPTSPPDADKFTDSATALADLATSLAKLATQPLDEDDLPILDDPMLEDSPVAGRWPLRPVSAAQVGLPRNARSHQYNDPSNFLG